jgi:glycerol-3-phosphate acyltransferase PlsY
VPTGIIVARARGIDLRQVGSGNIGATNVGRALGRRWAIFVLIADAAKGYLPAFAAKALGATPWIVAATALAAVVGHMFTVFLKGRGGKGVATSFGAALALGPLAALAAFAVYVVLLALSPIFLWVFGERERATLAFAVAVAVLVTIRHADNIRRLVRGEELKA